MTEGKRTESQRLAVQEGRVSSVHTREFMRDTLVTLPCQAVTRETEMASQQVQMSLWQTEHPRT